MAPGGWIPLLHALISLLACAGLAMPGSPAHADDSLLFKSARDVNEGRLQFLATPPDKPVHHHQNRFTLLPTSFEDGWVALRQCHDHLDAVPSLQITFREGAVRGLAVVETRNVRAAWVEGASIQVRDLGKDARLCLTAETRTLRNPAPGQFLLVNGPFMRRFLDGYYPMRVSLEVDYPADRVRIRAVSPDAPGHLLRDEAPGRIRLDALFEGELRTQIQFESLAGF